jgi:hypothetical protein
MPAKIEKASSGSKQAIAIRTGMDREANIAIDGIDRRDILNFLRLETGAATETSLAGIWADLDMSFLNIPQGIDASAESGSGPRLPMNLWGLFTACRCLRHPTTFQTDESAHDEWRFKPDARMQSLQ